MQYRQIQDADATDQACKTSSQIHRENQSGRVSDKTTFRPFLSQQKKLLAIVHEHVPLATSTHLNQFDAEPQLVVKSGFVLQRTFLGRKLGRFPSLLLDWPFHLGLNEERLAPTFRCTDSLHSLHCVHTRCGCALHLIQCACPADTLRDAMSACDKGASRSTSLRWRARCLGSTSVSLQLIAPI